MNINLNANKVSRTLFITMVILVIAHIVQLIIYYVVGDEDVFDFVDILDMGYEGNLPTLFSSLMFMLNGLLFYLIYANSKQNNGIDTKYWLGLCLVFLFLGVDEGTKIHENIGDFTENFVEAEGFLYYPWVLSYVSLFLLAVFYYFRFYLRLDEKLQLRLALSAIVFLSGAVGLEIISAEEAYANDTDTIKYSVLYTTEEILELTGLLLLVDGLLSYIERNLNLNQISIKITKE